MVAYTNIKSFPCTLSKFFIVWIIVYKLTKFCKTNKICLAQTFAPEQKELDTKIVIIINLLKVRTKSVTLVEDFRLVRV